MVTPVDLANAIIKGKAAESVQIARELLSKGIDVEKLIEEGTTSALEALDVKCTSEEFNLLEILLAGRAMMHVMDVVVESYPKIEVTETSLGRIIVGTIMGDVHDFGKSVVQMIFKAAGFQVIDLGINVEPKAFVEAAKKHKAIFIGVSSLIVTTIPFIQMIKPLAQAEGLTRVKVIAGGAAMKQCSAEFLNVDAVVGTVFEGLRFCREVD